MKLQDVALLCRYCGCRDIPGLASRPSHPAQFRRLKSAATETLDSPSPRLWWFDFAHHPEPVEGRDFQPNPAMHFASLNPMGFTALNLP